MNSFISFINLRQLFGPVEYQDTKICLFAQKTNEWLGILHIKDGIISAYNVF